MSKTRIPAAIARTAKPMRVRPVIASSTLAATSREGFVSDDVARRIPSIRKNVAERTFFEVIFDRK